MTIIGQTSGSVGLVHDGIVSRNQVLDKLIMLSKLVDDSAYDDKLGIFKTAEFRTLLLKLQNLLSLTVCEEKEAIYNFSGL